MSKRDSLKKINIGQSAAKLRIGERSETSLKRRTLNKGKWETYGFIYFLLNPITSEVKYIGKTTRNIFIRLGEHCRLRDNVSNKELQLWLKSINCEPKVLIKKYPIYLLAKAEIYWIKYYSKDNRLLNFQVHNNKSYAVPTKIGQFKKILRISPSTGEIKEYLNLTEAALKNNVHIGNISRCATGSRKTTGGFIWRYSPTSNES